MAKPVYERNKHNINLCVVGHQGHGKTSLTAALTQALAKRGQAEAKTHAQLDSAPEEQAGKLSVHASMVEYESATRHYTHVDLPGHLEYIENFLAGMYGSNGAILVVSALEGVQAQTREHVILARQTGVPAWVVFLSHCDQVQDYELLERREREIQQLLSEYEYPGEDIAIVRGSSLGSAEGEASMYQLLDALDGLIPTPIMDDGKPFEMPIAKVFDLDNVGVVATGFIGRGKVRVGDRVEILGAGDRRSATVKGLEMFGRVPAEGIPNDRIGVLLEGIEAKDIARGQVLVAPGSSRAHTKCTAQVVVLSEAEGGRHTPFFNGYKPQVWFGSADAPVRIELLEGTDMANPGDSVQLTLNLDEPLVFEAGFRFALREGHQTIAAGIVHTVLE